MSPHISLTRAHKWIIFICFTSISFYFIVFKPLLLMYPLALCYIFTSNNKIYQDQSGGRGRLLMSTYSQLDFQIPFASRLGCILSD